MSTETRNPIRSLYTRIGERYMNRKHTTGSEKRATGEYANRSPETPLQAVFTLVENPVFDPVLSDAVIDFEYDDLPFPNLSFGSYLIVYLFPLIWLPLMEWIITPEVTELIGSAYATTPLQTLLAAAPFLGIVAYLAFKYGEITFKATSNIVVGLFRIVPEVLKSPSVVYTRAVRWYAATQHRDAVADLYSNVNFEKSTLERGDTIEDIPTPVELEEKRQERVAELREERANHPEPEEGFEYAYELTDGDWVDLWYLEDITKPVWGDEAPDPETYSLTKWRPEHGPSLWQMASEIQDHIQPNNDNETPA